MLGGIGDGEIGKEIVDCAVMDIGVGNKKLISSLDFFYPSIQDPYMQGRIAVANMTSDLNAMGVYNIQQILMILGVCEQMELQEQNIATQMMIKGFNDSCKILNCEIVGGQTVFNKVPMIGGSVQSIADGEDIIYPYNIEIGDVLVQTKPLGTQPAVNYYQQMLNYKKIKENPTDQQKQLIFKHERRLKNISEQQIVDLYLHSVQSMGTFNYLSGKYLKEFQAHGGTDITGFGLLGHAKYVAEAHQNYNNNQKNQFKPLNLVIDKLVIFENLYKQELQYNEYNLLTGYSKETSGGLLMAMSKEQAEKYIKQLQKYGLDAWIVGKIEEGKQGSKNDAFLSKNPEVLEIKYKSQWTI